MITQIIVDIIPFAAIVTVVIVGFGGAFYSLTSAQAIQLIENYHVYQFENGTFVEHTSTHPGQYTHTIKLNNSTTFTFNDLVNTDDYLSLNLTTIYDGIHSYSPKPRFEKELYRVGQS